MTKFIMIKIKDILENIRNEILNYVAKEFKEISLKVIDFKKFDFKNTDINSQRRCNYILCALLREFCPPSGRIFLHKITRQ